MENWTERLDNAVRRHEWLEVANILYLHSQVVPNNTRLQAVDAFIQIRKVEVDRFTARVIIQHCNREQRHRLLNIAQTHGWWDTVDIVLEKDDHDEQQKRVAVDAFIENATEKYYGHIIPHCEREQLDRVLNRAITEGWWSTVISVLEKGVHDNQQKEVAVDAFIESATEKYYGHIILQCDREQLDRVLNRAVTEGWWSTVIKVLENGVLDKKQKEVAVDAFIENATEDDYADIIPHCDREHLDRVLNIALTERWWFTVINVLGNGVHEKQQKKLVVSAYIENATEKYYGHIIPHCDREQLDRVLNRAVTEGWWTTVIKVLENGVHDKQRKKVAVDAFIENATEHYYLDIIQFCDRDQLDRVLIRALTEGWWSIAIKVLEKGVYDKQEKKIAIDAFIENATEHYYSDIIQHCDRDQLDRVLNRALTEGWWSPVIKVLDKGFHDKQQQKVAVDKFIENATGSVYANIIQQCDRDQLDRVLNRALTEGWWSIVIRVLSKDVSVESKHAAVDVYIDKATVCGLYKTPSKYSYIMPHCDREQLNRVLDRAVTEKRWDIASECIKKGAVITTLHTWKTFTYHTIQQRETHHSSETVKMLIPRNTSTLLTTYVDWSQLSEDQKTVVLMVSLEELRITDTLLPVAVNLSDLSQEELSVCVMILMKEDRWDKISKVCLCHVWEQVGRELLQEAVDQRRWSIVKQWADHTVYDDQRWWAVKEAYKEKQWRVMLLLSDHGLTEIELMWVYYRLAMFADWATVGHMLQRGVDVTDLREVVENAMISTKTARDPAKRLALGKRWQRLKALEQQMSNVSSRHAYKAAKSCMWRVVMPSLHYQHGKIRHQLIQITLKVAIEHKAWHVVMQLIKLDMEQSQRDSLFTDMLRQQQWGVCRALLDHGVSVHLCLDVLPQLMEEDQWLLVARMMEYDLDDAKRREVMQRAMERRQGSVVWRCISTMQHYRLSEVEREQLFHQAISRCVLQAVKPLIEEKDQTGLRHRDGALLVGIELRQWDVVDYCQEQRADINMKNDEGETPLNRAARKKDWKTVKALLVRGGDTNILDRDYRSLLYRTIEAKQMDLTKLVIEYHGDINKKIEHVTPLQSLINGRYGDVIHHTLMWCPDQAKVVNEKGETTLHAIALDNRPEFLYHQVVRGVNPLRVTKSGHSVLLYAVMNEHCAQRMVAECIRLGFSTHQPALTGTHQQLGDYFIVSQIAWIIEKRPVTSPLLSAIMRAHFILAHMLYESGSCSYSQLFHMYNDLLEASDPLTERGQRLRDAWQDRKYIEGHEYKYIYKQLTKSFTSFLPYLREMATTPRSLVSTCRLVISHCLNVRRRYERDVYQLGLTDRMTNYILFSDLTDPDYERHLHGTLSQATEVKNEPFFVL